MLGIKGERRTNMRALVWVVATVSAVATSGAGFAQGAGPFDGKWTTIVSCPQAEGAGSFTLLVDAKVKAGFSAARKALRVSPGGTR